MTEEEISRVVAIFGDMDTDLRELERQVVAIRSQLLSRADYLNTQRLS